MRISRPVDVGRTTSLVLIRASSSITGRGTANIRKNKGFFLPAIGKDLVYTAPADAFQTIRIYKRGGRIRLTVDDVLALAYDDDGKTYGPVHTHSGWIGLRQMAHTQHCRYGHVRIYPLEP